ncbi:MAG: hypothetical protein KAH48_03250, partial [Chlorobi bacterium]|nr:hypothetical protein [Chlorobiota bacterium]
VIPKKYLFSGLISLLIFSVSVLAAEENDTFPKKNEIIAFHPRIGYNFNFYSGEFESFQGAVDCGLFQEGSGTGLSYSLYAETLIYDDLHFSLGLGYFDRSGELTVSNSFPARDDVQTGGIVEVMADNTVFATLNYLSIMPEIRYTAIPNFISGPLRFFGGMTFAIPLAASFEQKEKILSPSNAVFKHNNRQERLIASGDINSISSLMFGLHIGFENMLKAGNSSHFTQQLAFDFFLNDVCDDVTWKMFGIRLELGYRFGINKEERLPMPPPSLPLPLPEEIPETKNIVKASGTIYEHIDFSIKEIDAKLYTGNELLSTLPLVNALFFEQNSSDIHASYILESNNTPSFFRGDAVDIQRYVVPRIAAIMKKNPKSKLLLYGGTSGKNVEPAGGDLAKKRTSNVREAFINAGVESKRIKLKHSLFPTIKSNQDYELGRIENQRVDIFLENASLQEYVNIEKYAEAVGNLALEIKSDDLIADENIEIYSEIADTTIVCNSTGVYDSRFITRGNGENLINFSPVLTYKDTTIQRDTTIRMSDLESISVDLNLNNFEAVIRFDYNSSRLNASNKALLKQMT